MYLTVCDLVTSKSEAVLFGVGLLRQTEEGKGNSHFLLIAQRHRAETEGYIPTGAMLSLYIPHRLHHNGM